MSITLAGLILGLVLGRVLAGIISNFASWRYVYWMAVGLQSCELSPLPQLTLAALVLEYFTLPDTPDKALGISYPHMVSKVTSSPQLIPSYGPWEHTFSNTQPWLKSASACFSTVVSSIVLFALITKEQPS